LAARADADRVLAELVAELQASQHAVRGVAIAIAARYRSLIDAVPDAVTIHDENGRILDANAAACGIYGRDRDTLRQLGVNDLNPSLPHDHMSTILANARLGSTSTVETTNLRGDGSGFPVEVHSNVYMDGNEKRVVAIARDITARKQVDRDLRASEARFRLFLQAMDKGVVVQDERGRILSCNPAACRIVGRSEAELQAMRSEHFAAWSLLDESGHAFAIDDLPNLRALRTGRTVNSTLVGIYLPHLGIQRWLSVTSVPQFAENGGRPIQVVSAFDDVTAMKHESELFAQTQSLAQIGGWQYGFGDDALVWTAQLYAICDLPPASGISLDRMIRFFPTDAREQLQAAIAEVRAGGTIELDLRMSSAIGRRRWVRIVARPIRHGDTVTGLIGTLQDITERKLVEVTLRNRALTDALTGLPNRDAVLEAAGATIDAAGGHDGPTLIHINLDRFRSINDVLGHGAGDRLLAMAARRLRDCLTNDSLCARFGGDEFLVLLPGGASEDQAARIAQRLAATFDEPFLIGQHEFRLTVSIGIARHPDDGATLQQLVSHAGAAMLEAKRRGRNAWFRYSPALARRAGNRLRIETHLRNAIAANEFHLEFQPQVDLGTQRALGAEALLRWTNPELGPMAPDLFVPYAESNGDIIAIGAWTIREACRQLREWRDRNVDIPYIAVNASFRQVLSGTLAGTVIAALREFDLPGEALEIELTERVFVEDLSDSQQTFAMLRGLGVKLVIDDFGEGYSALGYLRRLPIDGIKISHGFMQHVPGVPSDTAICDAIIRIGSSLGLMVIAEGVENEQQLEFLRERGTRLAQGYLFSRPLGANAFAAYLASQPSRGVHAARP
ncbi:MAG: EAL domain-containing protein, partial [Xanthomonadales bacterium]|nr:EAL domain-containing protein [Xanthomonadales bacterium]